MPQSLRIVSEWCWRSLIIVGTVLLLCYAAAYLSFIMVPIIVATMVVALLEPIRRRLVKAGVRPQFAAIGAFVFGVLFVTGGFGAAIGEVTSNFDELSDQASSGLDKVSEWLETGPLRVRAGGLTDAFDRAVDSIKDDPSKAVSGTFSLLSTTGGLIGGGLLTLITTLFLIKDRGDMWEATLGVLPTDWKAPVDRAGRAAWSVLLSYVKVTLTSAVVDGIAVGATAGVLGLPVAFALGMFTFLFAFIPTVGAIASGVIAVLVALVSKGPTVALIMAAVVLVVQQLDANVMYPLLAKRNLSLHPLASLMLVAAGGILGGLVGAFIAVPVAAMAIAIIKVSRRPDLDEAAALAS